MSKIRMKVAAGILTVICIVGAGAYFFAGDTGNASIKSSAVDAANDFVSEIGSSKESSNVNVAEEAVEKSPVRTPWHTETPSMPEGITNIILSDEEYGRLKTIFDAVCGFPYTGDIDAVNSVKEYFTYESYEDLLRILKQFDTSATKSNKDFFYNNMSYSAVRVNEEYNSYIVTYSYVPQTEEESIEWRAEVHSNVDLIIKAEEDDTEKFTITDFGYLQN